MHSSQLPVPPQASDSFQRRDGWERSLYNGRLSVEYFGKRVKCIALEALSF
jgi:hypothetical protein